MSNTLRIDPWFDCHGAAITKMGSFGNVSGSYLACMNQTHSTTVAMVDVQNNQWESHAIHVHNGQLIKDALPKSSSHPFPYAQAFSSHWMVDADALITTHPSIILSVRVADCLPIMIQSNQVMAIIHAGRMGTLNGIARKVCMVMRQFSAGPFTIWFGPCCCVACYEIHQETATHFDLVKENKHQIEDVLAEAACFLCPNGHQLCTQCHADQLYSYRNGDATNRNVFFMANSWCMPK